MANRSAPLNQWESLILAFACLLVFILFFLYFDKVLGNIDNTPSGTPCKSLSCGLG